MSKHLTDTLHNLCVRLTWGDDSELNLSHIPVDIWRILHLTTERPIVAELHITDQDGGVARCDFTHKLHLVLKVTLDGRKRLLVVIKHLQNERKKQGVDYKLHTYPLYKSFCSHLVIINKYGALVKQILSTNHSTNSHRRIITFKLCMIRYPRTFEHSVLINCRS